MHFAQAMDPPPPPANPGKLPVGFRIPPPPWSTDIHSRASDAGQDSASDAGSTATMESSLSAATHHTDRTEVSAASTAFNPPQHVHVFNLDDFAGHAIHAILEDGERDQEEEEAQLEVGSQQESVRAGSVVSNIEQRLGEVADKAEDLSHLGEFEGQGASSAFGASSAGLAHSSHMGAGSSSAHAGAPPSSVNPEQMRMALLEQMQYRDLSASDLQLLQQLEAELASLRRSQAPSPAAALSSAGPAAGSAHSVHAATPAAAPAAAPASSGPVNFGP